MTPSRTRRPWGASVLMLLLAGAARAQDAEPAGEAGPVAAPPPPRVEFIDTETIRRANGMIVRYYRVNAVDAKVVAQELEVWKTKEASVVPVGPAIAVGVTKGAVVSANTLRIEETADNWPVLERILAIVDAPQPQVYVEAKIVEISYDDDLRIGLGPSNIRVDRPVGDLFFKRVDVIFDNVLGGTDSTELTFGSDDKFVKFDYILQLGKSGAKTEVLSQPGVYATQGETATIKIGDEEPIVKQSIAGNNVSAATEFKPVGLELEVQPLMIGRDLVRVRIKPRLSRVSDFRITSTSSDRDVVNPVISEREVSTVVDVIDGDTVVLGGLQQTAKLEGRKGIPILMDIPLLGYLFGSTTKRDVKTELVFFVTISIVRPGEGRVVLPPGELERTQ